MTFVIIRVPDQVMEFLEFDVIFRRSIPDIPDVFVPSHRISGIFVCHLKICLPIIKISI